MSIKIFGKSDLSTVGGIKKYFPFLFY